MQPTCAGGVVCADHLKQNPLIPDVGALITRDPHNPFVCTDPYLAQSRFSATFANP